MLLRGDLAWIAATELKNHVLPRRATRGAAPNVMQNSQVPWMKLSGIQATVILCFSPLSPCIVSTRGHVWSHCPPKESMNIQQVQTHTGDEVCRYVSCDNCNLKITHTSPRGIFFPPAGRRANTNIRGATLWCNTTSGALIWIMRGCADLERYITFADTVFVLFCGFFHCLSLGYCGPSASSHFPPSMKLSIKSNERRTEH